MAKAARTLRCDLHVHTTLSDGAFSPDEVVARAARGGIDILAITDHDFASELPIGLQAIEGRNIRIIAAAEMSGSHAGREYHLLVYFRGSIPPDFRAFCAERCRERAHRYNAAIEALGLKGLPPACNKSQDGSRALTRHHLAREIVASGHAKDLADAFRRFVGDGGVVPRISLPFTSLIARARAAGAFTSWAHPPPTAVAAHLGAFVDAGLDALEIYRPMQASRTRRILFRHVKAHRLAWTGGSDWHGWREPALGTFHVDGTQLEPFLSRFDLDAVA